MENVRPDCSLGASLEGSYAVPAYPYRYFNVDAIATAAASFAAGHMLQFLPDVTVTGADAILTINGSTANNTRLFTKSDPSYGAHIVDGLLKLTDGGSIVMR